MKYKKYSGSQEGLSRCGATGLTEGLHIKNKYLIISFFRKIINNLLIIY